MRKLPCQHLYHLQFVYKIQAVKNSDSRIKGTKNAHPFVEQSWK